MCECTDQFSGNRFDDVQIKLIRHDQTKIYNSSGLKISLLIKHFKILNQFTDESHVMEFFRYSP